MGLAELIVSFKDYYVAEIKCMTQVIFGQGRRKWMWLKFRGAHLVLTTFANKQDWKETDNQRLKKIQLIPTNRCHYCQQQLRCTLLIAHLYSSVSRSPLPWKKPLEFYVINFCVHKTSIHKSTKYLTVSIFLWF